MRGLRLPDKQDCLDAFSLYARSSLSFADAFNARYMQARGITEIWSWDTDFDGLAGINRLEPPYERG